jgi:hypothetical protein
MIHAVPEPLKPPSIRKMVVNLSDPSGELNPNCLKRMLPREGENMTEETPFPQITFAL